MTVTAASRSRAVLAESEAAAVDVVRAAYADTTPLRIIGAGTWLEAGSPVEAALSLDLSGYRGIIEYVPGDLTLTARAGTPLADIEDAAAVHNQWLPLDPFGSQRSTLGATIATASAGPLASSMGRPRDVTLGLGFITGYGKVVHGGGRVVKNVAGFDLVRLQTGAWGTLGVILEASMRLRARPDADETVSLPLPDDPSELDAFVARIRHADVAPLAAELLSAVLAERLGAGSGDRLLLRLAGSAVTVRAQRTTVNSLGPVETVSSDVWRQLRAAEPPQCNVVRISRRPTELGRLWRAVRAILRRQGGVAHASVERGVVRCWLDGDGLAVMSSLGTLDPGDVRIVERLTGSPMPTTANDRVSRALRDAFDPARILNRGILGREAA